MGSPTEIFGMVTVGTAAFLGQQAMTLGGQRERAAVASAVRTLDVPLSYIVQVSFFRQERLSILGVCGSVLVCSSVLLLVAEKLHVESSDGHANARVANSSGGVVFAKVAEVYAEPTYLGQSVDAIHEVEKPAGQSTREVGDLLRQTA